MTDETDSHEDNRRDTSIMEYTAEDLITHKLIRGGILVAKPKFDQLSADLIGLMHVGDHAKFCRIQCKGRTIKESGRAKVEVFAPDVTNAFILFLFVETGDQDATHLFAFFGSEIRLKWTLNESGGRQRYSLSISESKFEEWCPYRVTEARIASIKQLITHANTTDEFKHVSTAKAALVTPSTILTATAHFIPKSETDS